jgi:hypothetical protein
MRPSRTRAPAVSCLVLALSLVAAPAALAQDAPEQALTDLMAAIEAKGSADLAAYFCPEHADQAAAFDVASLAARLPGIDPSTILDAIILDTEITALEVVNQSDSEAVVRFEGSIATGMDVEKLGPFAEAFLGATGEEVTPELVEELINQLTADMTPTVIDIADEVTVTPNETGTWVVCDELGGETASPEASAASSAAPEPSASPAG